MTTGQTITKEILPHAGATGNVDLRTPDHRGTGDVCALRRPAGQSVRRAGEQDQCI